VSYAQAWERARSIAQALINRGLSVERPVVILSENDPGARAAGLGCLVAGVPFVPTSPAYSLISDDFDKLRHVLSHRHPGSGVCRRCDASVTAKPSGQPCGERCRSRPDQRCGLEGRASTPFAELVATPPPQQVDAAMAATGPDTITKFLFTSGSTKLPKAVINTHRMWCANQQQMAQSMPVSPAAAGAGGLAAVEPHLWWQPQLWHGGLQRRHAVH
jgi:feruloyl-CoA synthase